MANNRLYLANTKTNQFVCIAKAIGGAWRLGNVTLLGEFLYGTFEDDDKTCLVLGCENDSRFYKAHIEHAENINVDNKWEYWE